MSLSRQIRKIWAKFLAGPGWIRETHGLGFIFRHYRSPSLKLLFWCMAWYDRMFSWSARLLLIIFLFAFFFSSLSMRSPAILLYLFLSALLIADFVIGWIFLPRLKIVRTLPLRVRCGIPFTIQYSVTNLRKIFAYDINIDPNLPTVDLYSTENTHFFSFPPQAETTASLGMIAHRRGDFYIPQGIAESCFPFNIFKHCVLFSSGETLLVHPMTSRITGLFSSAGETIPFQSESTAPSPGESMDFFGCRPYRTGDTPRKINWRATARLNTPVVKEFQKQEVAQAAVILDNWQPASQTANILLSRLTVLTQDFKLTNRIFEAAVSMTASVVEMLAQRGFSVKTLAIGDGIHHIPKQRVQKTVGMEVLDKLALARTSVHDPFSSSGIEAITAAVSETGMVFLILMRYDDAVSSLLDVFESSHIPVVTILVTDGPRPAHMPDSVHVVPTEPLLTGADVVL